MIVTHPTGPACFLDAELRRDASLSPAARTRLMRAMLAVSLGGGTVLFLLGAWPVIGFLGLDVLLVWGAFKLYARDQAGRYERIVVDRDALHIERHESGQCRAVAVEPAFLNVLLNEENPAQRPIRLCRYGRCAEIGRWLGPAERLRFALMLKQALRVRRKALAGS